MPKVVLKDGGCHEKAIASTMMPHIEIEARIVATLLGNALLGDDDE